MKIENYKELFLDITKKLVAIKSFINDQNEWPSKEQKKALDLFEATAKELGFARTVINEDGKWGWTEIGEGEELIGILAHIDVVPPGDLSAWTSEPFEMIQKGEDIFGRGVTDDKGPVALMMVVLKAILDSGIKLNKRIRIIIGTDEETLWRGIDSYKETEEIPYIAFTPDSVFPATYAEKELLNIDISGPGTEMINLEYNNAYNSVVGSAVYKGDLVDEIKQNADVKGFKYELKEDSIEFIGEQVHAKNAADGHHNALVNLVKSLPEKYDNVGVIKFIKENVDDGQAVNIFGLKEDEISGKLTFNVAKLIVTPEKTYIGIDSRIPVEASNLEEFEEKLIPVVNDYGLTYLRADFLPSVYFEKNSDLIKSLLESYEKITGRTEDELISSGGATYARAIPNCLAFGPKFQDEPSSEHMPNERANLSNLLLAGHVYYDFLIKESNK